MMSRLARGLIRDLDDALIYTGDRIMIGRVSDTPEGGQEVYWCEDIPAKVTLAQPQEIVTVGTGGIAQDTVVIVSPTPFDERQWPVPPRRDDRITIVEASGRELRGNIEAALEFRVQGEIVRYELKCRS